MGGHCGPEYAIDNKPGKKRFYFAVLVKFFSIDQFQVFCFTQFFEVMPATIPHGFRKLIFPVSIFFSQQPPTGYQAALPLARPNFEK